MLMMPMISDVIVTLLIVGTITFVIVLILIFARINIEMSDELFRKLMHMSAILMTPMSLILTGNYRDSAAVLLIFALLAEIGLRILPQVFNKLLSGNKVLENTAIGNYENFFVERKNGEVKRSFVIYCLLQACLIIVCGLLGDMRIILLEISVWGIGDALAALVGKKRGVRHFKLGDKNKTYAGSAAMCISSFITAFVLLMLMYDYSVLRIVSESVIIAVFAAAAELFSPKGIDTVTIPVVVCGAALCLNYLM